MRAWTGLSFPVVVAVALAGLTLWLKQAVELPVERRDGKLRHDPDSIVEGLRAATFDPLGRPLHYLDADRLVHYPDDDSSHLVRPRVRYTPNDQPEMRAEAESGLMLGKQKEVRLFDRVRVVRLDSPGSPGWIATMQELTAFPDQGTVSSSSPFVFTQGAAHIEGIGFAADQNVRTITLNSRVRGVFPPRTAPSP